MRKLVLFFDLYCSFVKYDREGLLLRDLLLYEKLIDEGVFGRVDILTYDDCDHALLANLQQKNLVSPRIGVLTPPRWLRNSAGAVLFSLIAPFLHRRVMAQASMFKSHQVSGAWTALLAKWLFGKPLLFRVGYPLSMRFRMEYKPIKYRLTRLLETLLVRASDRVAVTSHAMQAYYGAMSARRRVNLLPSYVDLSGFMQVTSYDVRRPILYIGRLEAVKNVGSLIEACGRIGIALDVYGGGSKQGELEALARTLDANVTFYGFVSNAQLMELHHHYAICVLCSTREGMPKSLIEAMASGLVCISTKTDGALELIEEGNTGYFVDGFGTAALERKLREVLANFDPAVGRRARAFVRSNNTLEQALRLESDLVEEMCLSDPREGPPARAAEIAH